MVKKKKRSFGSIHGIPVRDRGRIVIRAVRKDPPDLHRLSLALIAQVENELIEKLEREANETKSK